MSPPFSTENRQLPQFHYVPGLDKLSEAIADPDAAVSGVVSSHNEVFQSRSREIIVTQL
jgi:hypothetical protein